MTVARGTNLKYDKSIVPYHLVLEAKDSVNFNIGQYFAQAVTFIKQALNVTNVLVHCMAGISRSATIVIAYYMTEHGVTYYSAMRHIKQCRPIVFIL